MTNIAYTCKRCGLRIDADDPAVMLAKDVPVYGASIDPTGFQEDKKVAHEGHEEVWLTLGYRVVKRGPLRELVP